MYSRKNLIFSVLAFLFLVGCKQETNQNSATEVPPKTTENIKENLLPEWARDAVVYEVNLRQYTPEGTFKSFAEHLPRLKELGADILWFMPIYPISKKERKGTLGSYYSVGNYRAVNPEHGTMKDFEELVAQIHAMDMHIILDWVPNHTGWDHPWITAHPEWYTQDKDGNIIDPIDPGTGESWGWTDVADLNYDNQEMRKEMISDMMFWVKEKNIDGFRQDVAHNVPDDFWDMVKAEIVQLDRPIFMLAEAENPSHRNKENFHSGYGWSFHHLMNDLAKGEKNVDDIVAWIEEDRKKHQKGFPIHFTTNHDENTWNGTVFERLGEAHKVLSALSFFMEGMPLIYTGQEEPIRKRLKFFEKDEVGYDAYAYTGFFKTLTQLKHGNIAMWNGEHGGLFSDIGSTSEVLVGKRNKGDNTVSGIFNLSGKSQTYTFKNELSGRDIFKDKYESYKTGSSVTLAPWEFHILTQ